MKKPIIAVMLLVSLLKSEEINIWSRISDDYTPTTKIEDISGKPSQSNSIPSSEYTSNKKKEAISSERSIATNILPQCMYFEVIGVRQLNIRNYPGKSSSIVGRANSGESVCIYESQGKWARSDRGWLSMKYLRKDVGKNKFLLADIDHDGQKERLQWDNIPSDDPEIELYQLKLFDNDNRLLWEGPRENDPLVVGYEHISGRFAVIFDDIDRDGNTELIISAPPSEGVYSPGSEIYRWDGKKFIKITRTRHGMDLVWTDAPYGKTLKWTKISDKDYRKRKKIWWVGEFFQMPNNELPIVEIAGVQYPDYRSFFRSKAKIRFTSTGAVIEEWIK